ncbi:MAG TPA: hypothetical protein VGX26_02480 [Solirubrobacteraceae bacterium]|jgi:hypothetical protein|nr:hypothetical protein [Solirubrobacteraceae bacterium]
MVAMRARALAGSSAVTGLVILAAMTAAVVGQLMSHFGVSYQEGLLVVSLVAAGSLVFFWLFPYLIPVIGTIRLLLFYFGTGVVVGW